jgi:hypothetical protein
MNISLESHKCPNAVLSESGRLLLESQAEKGVADFKYELSSR